MSRHHRGDTRNIATLILAHYESPTKYTGDKTSPVTKFHRSLRWLPNFTGNQSTPVTKLHRWPKVHRWTSLLRQYGTVIPACLKEAEHLALPWHKILFLSRAAGGSVQIFGHRLKHSRPTWMRRKAWEKSRKPGFYLDNFSRWVESIIVPMEERNCFQLPPTVRHPLPKPRPPPRLQKTRAMEATGWSYRPQT